MKTKKIERPKKRGRNRRPTKKEILERFRKCGMNIEAMQSNMGKGR